MTVEKYLCNKSSHYEIMPVNYKKKSLHPSTKSTLFKDNWDTKEETGKSCIVHNVVCQKAPSRAEAVSNSIKSCL